MLITSANKAGSCIIKVSCTTRTRYARSTLNGQRDSAHRNAWRIRYGEIPDGMCVLHHCDNPPCVNPAHLFLGTQADNIRDMMLKGRNRYKAHLGSTNPNATVSRSVVYAVLRDSNAGMIETELVKKHGVSKGTVNNIRSGKHWAPARVLCDREQRLNVQNSNGKAEPK